MSMIDVAEAEGRIEPGRTTIVESTSGNTGIALAFVCAAKGYDLILTMPQGMSRERENLLRLYGAEVVLVESMGGMDEAVAGGAPHLPRARRLLGARTSSPTPPTRRSTGARPPRRSGATSTAGWTCSWPASARAGRSPAAASGSRSATRTCAWSPWSRRPRRCCRAGCPGRTRSRASAPASCRRCSTATWSTRSCPSTTRTRIETARLRAAPRGRAGRDLVRRGAVRGDRGRLAPGDARQADRGDRARLGRALRRARRSSRRDAALGDIRAGWRRRCART